MADKLKDFIQSSRQEWDRHEIRSDFKDQLFDKILNETPIQKVSTSKSLWKPLAVAASLIALVVCGILINFPTSKEINASIVADPSKQKENSSEDFSIADESKNQDHPMIQYIDPTKEKINTFKAKNKKSRVVSFKERKRILLADQTIQSTKDIEPTITIPQPVPAMTDTEKSSSPASTKVTSDVALQAPVSEDKSKESQETVDVNPSTQQSFAQETHEVQTVGSFLKKGFLKFISKKTKQWTNNAVDLQTNSATEPTALAFNLKSNLFEISKSFPLQQEGE